MNIIDEIDNELEKLRSKRDPMRYLKQICVLEFMKGQWEMIFRNSDRKVSISEYIDTHRRFHPHGHSKKRK